MEVVHGPAEHHLAAGTGQREVADAFKVEHGWISGEGDGDFSSYRVIITCRKLVGGGL